MSSTLSMNSNIKRESNIELLRIFASMFVIILHYNHVDIGGALEYVKGHGVNQHILLVLEYLCVGAVDIFILISGYFGSRSKKIKFLKVLDLLIQTSMFRIVIYILGPIITGNLSVFSVAYLIKVLLPVNYYVVLYVVLYLISPYINLILGQLLEKQLKRFLILLIMLFSVWPTVVDAVGELVSPLKGLSSISAYGSDYGYTIVNFILVYIIGATLRMVNVELKKTYSIFGILVCTILLVLMGKYIEEVSMSYCNPIVIMQAVSVFLFFKDIKLNNKLINKLSQSAFTCFLIHEYILEYFDIQRAVQKGPVYMMMHIFVVCVVIYSLAYIIFCLYQKIMRPITNCCDYLVQKSKLDFWLSNELTKE